MKNLINIFGILILVITIVSCGSENTNDNQQVNQLVNDDESQNNTKIIETLKKKPLFSAKVETFKHVKNKENLSFTNIVLSADMNCETEPNTCEEIRKVMGGKKLVFNSDEEASSNEDEKTVEEYAFKQGGDITVGDNSYSTDFYFNLNDNFFNGTMMFSMKNIKSLNDGDQVILLIKGKIK